MMKSNVGKEDKCEEEDHEGEEIEMRHDKQQQQQHKIHTINWIHTYIYV